MGDWATADGSAPVPLVEHPADDFHVGWDPDGRRVVFASDRSGSTALWAIAVRDRKRFGSPELLMPETGRFEPIGMTANGALFYGVTGPDRSEPAAQEQPPGADEPAACVRTRSRRHVPRGHDRRGDEAGAGVGLRQPSPVADRPTGHRRCACWTGCVRT